MTEPVPQPTESKRICECREQTFSADTDGWCVDAEGVELCPGCAADIRAEWANLSEDERRRYA